MKNWENSGRSYFKKKMRKKEIEKTGDPEDGLRIWRKYRPQLYRIYRIRIEKKYQFKYEYEKRGDC